MDGTGQQRGALEREREARERQEFLAESSRLLADTLEYEQTLATVARLALPHLGAWCFVDLTEPDGGMRRLAVVHPDPEKQELARRLESGWPPERDDPFGVPHAVRTRQSEVIPEVTEEMLEEAAHGEENARLLRRLGIGSLMVVPLLARGEVLGAITYVAPQAHYTYGHDDLALAEDLAARCAISIDNARLYNDAVRAREEAEEASRAKTLFLSTMSHELRTPLNAIAGYADLLESGVHGELTEEQRADVKRIVVNQRHLLGLVNSVLDYSRIEAGKIHYEVDDVPLAPVLEDVQVLVLPLADKRGIERPRIADVGNLAVRADREKVQQILTNLLVNAIKYSPDGGDIEARCTDGGGAVTVEVQDHGLGIPEEHLESIFRPFVQVRDGRTRTEEGTGLGLAISRDLARGMGGDLTVRSVVGDGSVFKLTLPRAGGAAAAASPPRRAG